MIMVRRVANLATVAMEWEEHPGLRVRAKQGMSLMTATAAGMNHCLGSLKDCAENHAVLMPVLEGLLAAYTLDTPSVDLLGAKCKLFLQLAAYPDASAMSAVAHRDAWSLKRCLTTLKRKWSRQETPKDCGVDPVK